MTSLGGGEVMAKKCKRWNHAYIIAFSADSKNEDRASRKAIMEGMDERIRELRQTGEVDAAVGAPFDSYCEEYEDGTMGALKKKKKRKKR